MEINTQLGKKWKKKVTVTNVILLINNKYLNNLIIFFNILIDLAKLLGY